MELHLFYFIIFPLIGIFTELLVSRLFKKATGFTSIIFSAFTIVLALLFCNDFNATQKGVQFIYSHQWINEWGIHFKLGLDGVGCIGTVLFSVVFFVILLLSRKREHNSLPFIMISLLQITTIGFLISYDFVLKILFWETSWIPVFFLIVLSSNKKFAVLYSRYWFLSESLIIIGAVLLFKTTGISYDLEKIAQVQAAENITLVIMSLMIAGTMIRSAVFPFSLFMNRAIQTCEESISIIITTVTIVIPFFFMISIITPLFLRELTIYTNVITIALLLSLLVCIVRLFIDKKISTVIYSQILMSNAIIFIWILRPSGELLNASIEMLVIKVILSIVIVYVGKSIIDNAKNISKLNTYLFFIALILAFGLPGVINIRPMLTLVSAWYSFAPYVSILIPAFIIIIFLYTFINVANLINIKTIQRTETKLKTTQNLLFFIIIAILVSISVWPRNIHYFSESYHKTFIGSNN